jgi:hypothetical protein
MCVDILQQARAKGVIKEGDTIIDGTKIISKEAKQAYSDFLRKRVKEGGDELKLKGIRIVLVLSLPSFKVII